MRSISFSAIAGVFGAAGEQLLGAVDFGRFAQDHGAAGSDDHVAGHAQRRIGRDAASCRPSRRSWCPGSISLAGIASRRTSLTRGNISATSLHPGLDRLRRAAEILHARAPAAQSLRGEGR